MIKRNILIYPDELLAQFEANYRGLAEKILSLEERIGFKDQTFERKYEEIWTEKILSLELKIDQLRT